MGTLASLIANPGALDIEGDRAAQRAQIAQAQAGTEQLKAATASQQTKNALEQRQIKDDQIWRDSLAKVFGQGVAATAPAATPPFLPSGANGPAAPAPPSTDGLPLAAATAVNQMAAAPAPAPKAASPNDLLHAALFEALRGGISGPGYMDRQKGILESMKSYQGLTEGEQKIHDTNLARVGTILQGVAAVPPEQQAAQYAQLLPELQALEPGIPATYPGPNGLASLLGSHGMAQAMAALGKTQADTKNTEATTANSTAQLPGLQADAAVKQQVAAGTVNGITPEQQVEQQRAAAQLAHENAVLAQTTRRGEQEHSEAMGRLGVDQNRNAREQQIYEQTYGAGSNEALRGVEPKLRSAATKDAQKAADDFQKAQSAERDMQTFLDLARSGNKEAHAYLSPEGVLTLNTARGVSRVNRQEIDAYAGAGSLFDRVASKAGKLTSGQSVPKDLLDDMDALHKAIAGNSAATYNSKLGAINQNYRSNFKPVEGPKATAPVAADPKVKAYADAYFGGDVAKAQAAIAQQRGGK